MFRVLLKATDNIPNEKVQVLQETVASYHGVPSREITREMIEEASEVDSRYYISLYRDLVIAGSRAAMYASSCPDWLKE